MDITYAPWLMSDNEGARTSMRFTSLPRDPTASAGLPHRPPQHPRLNGRPLVCLDRSSTAPLIVPQLPRHYATQSEECLIESSFRRRREEATACDQHAKVQAPSQMILPFSRQPSSTKRHPDALV